MLDRWPRVTSITVTYQLVFTANFTGNYRPLYGLLMYSVTRQLALPSERIMTRRVVIYLLHGSWTSLCEVRMYVYHSSCDPSSYEEFWSGCGVSVGTGSVNPTVVFETSSAYNQTYEYKN